ncbi:MAG TPA: AzlD domain-containing protein [Firmicutes bacterium]|nr:AzlD domain-containing protein [Bacillota bacterium]
MTGWVYWLAAVLVMALVTYIPRVLPLTLVRRRIESPFLRSFLYYMPFAVLGAMTFPAALYATDTPVSAAVGLAVALGMAFFGRQLLPVALASTAAVLLTECVMRLAHLL